MAIVFQTHWIKYKRLFEILGIGLGFYCKMYQMQHIIAWQKPYFLQPNKKTRLKSFNHATICHDCQRPSHRGNLDKLQWFCPHCHNISALLKPEFLVVSLVESGKNDRDCIHRRDLIVRSNTLRECFNNMDVGVLSWLTKPRDKSSEFTSSHPFLCFRISYCNLCTFIFLV